MAMGNNPVNRVDPNGIKVDWWKKLLAFLGIGRATNGLQPRFLKPPLYSFNLTYVLNT
jgi:hypothetical protein